MIRLQPGHTISQGIPGSSECITIEVPGIPAVFPADVAIAAPDEAVAQAAAEGKLWANYESRGRYHGARVAEYEADPHRVQPDVQANRSRQQEKLYRLIAMDLHSRGL